MHIVPTHCIATCHSILQQLKSPELRVGLPLHIAIARHSNAVSRYNMHTSCAILQDTAMHLYCTVPCSSDCTLQLITQIQRIGRQILSCNMHGQIVWIACAVQSRQEIVQPLYVQLGEYAFFMIPATTTLLVYLVHPLCHTLVQRSL